MIEYAKYMNIPTGNYWCDHFRNRLSPKIDTYSQDCKPYICPLNIIVSAALEELVFRKIIQQRALPAIAKLMPHRVRGFFEHPITRVIFSAAVFSLVHFKNNWETNANVDRFIGGLIYGALTEITGSIFPAIVAHSIWNYNIIAGEYNANFCQTLFPFVVNATKIFKNACD